MKILSVTESYAIQCALQTAAKKYSELCEQMKDAQRAAKAGPDSGFARLANQFLAQAQEADHLADLVAEYDGVALHNENDMLGADLRALREGLMSMSKKDYIVLAAAVADAAPAEPMKDDHRWCNGCDSAREFIARRIAEYAQEQRLEFNIIRFYKACGLPHLI